MSKIEEASEKLDETMKAVANRAFKASQLSDDWPDTVKLAALDSELGEVPNWPAAKRAYALAVLDEAFALPEPPLQGTVEINITEREAVLRRRIEELGK